MTDCIKYLVVASCVLVPMWIMASELNGDEYAKSAAGLATGAIVLGAMRIIESWWAKPKA